MSNNICEKLSATICNTLTPLIKGNYILLDLPYYSNIGDILIWKGTENFLKGVSGSCLGKHSKETFDFKPLPKDCTILLLGGGNFGDIWREHQEFRLEVMRLYPDNNIIVLPQTVFYEKRETLLSDIEKMNQHRHLTICARDEDSASILKSNNFKGVLLTLPDMAFCITQDELKSAMQHERKGTLLLMRNDKELRTIDEDCLCKDVSYEDWPRIEESEAEVWHYLMMHEDKESDTYFQTKYFPQRIEEGIQFASSYKEVYSTRLHVAILRLLLDLPVVMLDNSYGKNKGFYESWLKEAQLASMPSQEESLKINRILSQKAKEVKYEKILLDKKKEVTELKRQLDEESHWLRVNKDWAHSLLADKESILKENAACITTISRLRHKKKIITMSLISTIIFALIEFIIIIITIYTK